jgi:hypothetical protein
MRWDPDEVEEIATEEIATEEIATMERDVSFHSPAIPPPEICAPKASRLVIRDRPLVSAGCGPRVLRVPIEPAPLDHALDGDASALADGSYRRFIAMEEREHGLI